MTKELVTIKDNLLNQIITRGADTPTIFDKRTLALITDRMPEINRATRSFGKSNTQTTSKLMTLSMLSDCPWRAIKQCCAQIEKKRGALKETKFKQARQGVKLRMMVRVKQLILDGELNVLTAKRLLEKDEFELKNAEGVKIEDVSMSVETSDRIIRDLFLEDLDIQIQKIIVDIADSELYKEGALKEIGIFQDAYDEIRESHDIRKDWDEFDMEKGEIPGHIRTAFRQARRDILMTGKLNIGNQEYLEQYSVDPMLANILIIDHLNKFDGAGDITSLYDFLDEMAERFKDDHKFSMGRIGLKKMISEDFLYTTDNPEIPWSELTPKQKAARRSKAAKKGWETRKKKEEE